MKNINFTLLMLLLCTFMSVQGQEREPEPWLRVIPQEYSTLTQAEAEKIERLVAKGIYSDYWIVDSYALQQIIQNQQLSFSLPGQDFKANFSESWLGNNGNGHIVWEGKTKGEDGYAILLMNERTVFGHIKYQGEDYMIHSMEESNTSVIFKQAKSANSHTGSGCAAPSPLEKEEAPTQSDPTINGRLGATSNCDVRVLVYFTQEADNATANINQLALLGIAETNAAFSNSGISRNTVSLVSAGVELLIKPQNWDGSSIGPNISWDLRSLIYDQARFPNGDFLISGTSTRRMDTGADIVVCLTDDRYPEDGGVILSGHTNRRFAYALVETPLAITNFVFAHQIGHLFDCRHAHGDVDRLRMPYARGHFFYGNDGDIYGTLLANNTNSSLATTRIGYYSNPNVSYLGTPTGNALRDNARRIRERACLVANYVSSVNNPLTAAIVGPSSGSYNSFQNFQADVSGGGPGVYSFQWRISSTPFPMGSVQSTTSQFSTNLITNPYSSIIFIHLRVTSADGQVSTAIHPVSVWGGFGPSFGNRLGDSNNLGVYPNPANNKVILSLESAEAGQAKVQLYNALGKVVREENFYHQGESMQYKYNISDLTAGVYLVSVQIGDQTYSKKLVKSN